MDGRVGVPQDVCSEAEDDQQQLNVKNHEGLPSLLQRHQPDQQQLNVKNHEGLPSLLQRHQPDQLLKPRSQHRELGVPPRLRLQDSRLLSPNQVVQQQQEQQVDPQKVPLQDAPRELEMHRKEDEEVSRESLSGMLMKLYNSSTKLIKPVRLVKRSN